MANGEYNKNEKDFVYEIKRRIICPETEVNEIIKIEEKRIKN